MKPIRVLHIVGGLNRGGVETWLKHVVHQIDRSVFVSDFLVHTEQPASYDDEVRALGCRILRCPHTQEPIRYAKKFLAIVRESGPFDVLHSHVHAYSGFTLALGRLAGIPIRIAHSHNDTRALYPSRGMFRKLYDVASRRLLSTYCTRGIAVSEPAAEELFGSDWRNDNRFQVLHCGIDLSCFETAGPAIENEAVRSEFGFSRDALVFGHVGRFDSQKNHSFLVDTAAQIVRMDPRARFLFVGDGPLRSAVEERAADLGLQRHAVFAGSRKDVPRLMMGAMDVFLFPSIHEGLPLAIMEAQAAGLRSIVSEAVPPEAIVEKELTQRISLSVGAHEWARLACQEGWKPRFNSRRALESMAASRFSIVRSVELLSDIYMGPSGPSSADHLRLRPWEGRSE